MPTLKPGPPTDNILGSRATLTAPRTATALMPAAAATSHDPSPAPAPRARDSRE